MTAEPRISQLRVPAEEEWPDEVRDLTAGFADKLGFVPNIMPAFALLPGQPAVRDRRKSL